ncbi:monovalent cation/H(+) antiporter subunit G [candidate division FCPU426 bacterium]|nr:monovalent cation/H(+) antiporter subunit G [candidate division FCPU426 bacterium]
MDGITLTVYILLAVGLFFNFVGIVGLLRFPDVYTRLHAETKTTTFGTIFTSTAIAFYSFCQYFYLDDSAGLSLGIHVLLAIVVLAFTNATGSHAIAQAAYNRGQKPVQAVVDRLNALDLREDQEE